MIDVDTAVAIADAVEFVVASGGLVTVGRPLGHHDVDVIRDAAAQAAAEADPDVPVILGAVPRKPELWLVDGGESSC